MAICGICCNPERRPLAVRPARNCRSRADPHRRLTVMAAEPVAEGGEPHWLVTTRCGLRRQSASWEVN